MSDPLPERKINKKRLENLERLKKKQELKISKNKQKKSAQLAARKVVKETLLFVYFRENLFLGSCNFISWIGSARNCSILCLQKIPMIQRCKFLSIPNILYSLIRGKLRSSFPKRLRCVSEEQFTEINDDETKQRGYIETDDSSAEECDNEQILIPDNSREIEKMHAGQLQTAEEFLHQEQRCKQTAKLYKILSCIKGAPIFVQRTEIIQEKRQKLPIICEEQPIVEAINENPVVIICGETGSGKTTQVPQFLYEAGYISNGHLIGITEPRRIAAISMASRVGDELGMPEISSYQIRYEGNKTDLTRILFMTDGVLLKELQTDCTLSRYSVIIIDEAHERSIYSDVLIGLLSRICMARLRKQYPLKLVIMSATLRLDDFLQNRLFPHIHPKVVKVDSRQFPVAIYSERRTPENYLEAAFKKICKIHEQYPPGDILKSEKIKLDQKMKRRNRQQKIPDEVIDYDEFSFFDMDDDCEDFDEVSLEDDSDLSENKFPPLKCLPLYSMLPKHLQRKVFEERSNKEHDFRFAFSLLTGKFSLGNKIVYFSNLIHHPIHLHKNSRMCIISTNVAETSLTIPNIRYVVDSGKEKRRDFDPVTGVSRFVVDWCSKASANQRSGRAGRDDLGQITPLGYSLVQLPLAPAFAKMIIMSFHEGLLPYTITLVSALSVREPLIPVSVIREATVEDTQKRMEEILKQRKLWCSFGEAKLFGDHTVLLNVIGAADYEEVSLFY
uniref:RNA helicase n=1 Tax=Meloidogyne hapla TaxID=6305 RepID=A0A1I8BLN3_MELHA